MKNSLDPVVTRRLELLNKIPFLNSGGCAHAALNLYRYLHSIGYDKVEIVYMFRRFEVDLYIEASAEVTPVSCAHAIVKIDDDLYADSSLIGTMEDFLAKHPSLSKSITVSPEYVERTLELRFSWNTLFKKNKYVPVIQRILRAG